MSIAAPPTPPPKKSCPTRPAGPRQKSCPSASSAAAGSCASRSSWSSSSGSSRPSACSSRRFRPSKPSTPPVGGRCSPAPVPSREWTLDNYRDTLDANGFSNALLNSLAVAIPATVIPITIAAFAACAFSWMQFRGRYVLFVLVVVLVVPLQMALIPILRLYAGGASIGGLQVFPDLNLNGTFIGIWLAHTAFGLPLAVYLLRNYIGSLPSSIIESARIDGADHFTIFWRS